MQGCPSGLFGNEPVTLSEGLQQLVNEHTPLRNHLETLFTLCNEVEKAEDKQAPFAQLIQEVTDFEKSLRFHSRREEDYMFAMMEVYIGKSSGPLVVMEYEHEQAHGFIDAFLENTKNPDLNPYEQLKNATQIKNAYYTLIDHFAKEEAVLYPMAERMFSDEEKETLREKVSEIQ